MAVLIRLAPWILYAVGIHVGGRRSAALFAAISAAVIIAVLLLRGSRVRELILDGIAQRSVPEKVGHGPEFFRFNVTLTVVWLAGFLLSGVVLVALVLAGNNDTGIQVGIIAASVVIPFMVQKEMIGAVERKLAA